MKYIIMLFGDQATTMETRSKEWIKEMMQFMDTVYDDLEKAGELVAGEGLADPSLAKTVRIGDGVPVATDGPFAEAKESLAGYYIVDVDSEARALEIGRHIVKFTREPLEVRQVMDAPPEL
jgi:hypothetical protein